MPVPTFITGMVAGICLTGFLAIWFTTTYKEFSAKRINLTDLEKQLYLHEKLALEARGGPEASTAEGMLQTSRMLYREAAKGYNRVLRKPMNRIPSLLLGFRTADEEHGHQNKEEQYK